MAQGTRGGNGTGNSRGEMTQGTRGRMAQGTRGEWHTELEGGMAQGTSIKGDGTGNSRGNGTGNSRGNGTGNLTGNVSSPLHITKIPIQFSNSVSPLGCVIKQSLPYSTHNNYFLLVLTSLCSLLLASRS